MLRETKLEAESLKAEKSERAQASAEKVRTHSMHIFYGKHGIAWPLDLSEDGNSTAALKAVVVFGVRRRRKSWRRCWQSKTGRAWQGSCSCFVSGVLKRRRWQLHRRRRQVKNFFTDALIQIESSPFYNLTVQHSFPGDVKNHASVQDRRPRDCCRIS